MKHLIAILTILCFVKANAQFNSNSFEVTLSDLETNVYEKDTTAKSLIIYEKGNSYIDKNNFSLVTEIEKKIKIFNKTANNDFTITVPLYRSDNGKKKEKIDKIEAITYNISSGKILKDELKGSDIFEENTNPNYKLIKFTLPNIKNGSIITYKYTITSPFIYNYRSWYFQHSIPTLYSEYNASIPGNYEYHIKLVGYKELAIEETDIKKRCIEGSNGAYANCTISKYAMVDIPAIIEEDYSSTIKNYVSRIEYELKTINFFDGSIDRITKTWKDAEKELKVDPDVGKQLSKSTKDILPPSITEISNPLDQAKAIYEFVQDQYTWNGKYEIFKNVSVKNLIKTKAGKVSEINILLHNLLKSQKLEVYPVLLSTRKNGLATKIYPQISDFNYLVVALTIEGQTYLLDGTDPILAFNELPYKCLNQYGRKLDFSKGSEWIPIEATSISSIQQKINLTLDSDELILTGTAESSYQGYHAHSKKRTYFTNSSTYSENLINKYEDFNISTPTIECESKNDIKFKESFNLEIEDLNSVGDDIYIDPFIIKFFRSNPFQLQERTYPIDFGYKDSFLASIQINFGEDYTVEQLPKSGNYRLPEKGGTFLYSTNVNGNILTIFFRLSFNQPRYNAYHYSAIKELMNKVVHTQTKTLIVLKKKS